MSRRHYNNTAVPVALTAAITTGATSLPVASTAGFPSTPFTIGIERGTANEEVCLVTAVPDSTHFTATRGYDGTTAKAHDINKPVEHCVCSMDYDEANAHVNDSSLHQGAPTGVVLEFYGAESAVPAGWLLCDGRAVSRTTYATLHALLRDAAGAGSYPYGAGDGSTTFNVPDRRGRMGLGRDNMGGTSANRVTNAAADLFGGSAGAESVALSSSEMPVHTHVQNPHTHTQTAHTHTQVAHNHNAVHGSFFDLAAGGSFDVAYIAGGYNTYTDFVTASATPTINSTTAVNQSTTAVNQDAGGGAAHNNMPPYIACSYIIKT